MHAWAKACYSHCMQQIHMQQASLVNVNLALGKYLHAQHCQKNQSSRHLLKHWVTESKLLLMDDEVTIHYSYLSGKGLFSSYRAFKVTSMSFLHASTNSLYSAELWLLSMVLFNFFSSFNIISWKFMSSLYSCSNPASNVWEDTAWNGVSGDWRNAL